MRLLALAVCVAVAVPLWSAEAVRERVTIRGRLVLEGTVEEPGPVFLVTESGERIEIAIEGDNHYAMHDPLLADRLWEMEGYRLDDGRFDQRKMFTVKDGKRFKVTYYCEICHIVSYRPGRCMCCQETVELREVPAEE